MVLIRTGIVIVNLIPTSKEPLELPENEQHSDEINDSENMLFM